MTIAQGRGIFIVITLATQEELFDKTVNIKEVTTRSKGNRIAFEGQKNMEKAVEAIYIKKTKSILHLYYLLYTTIIFLLCIFRKGMRCG